jgi:hypothetical protein
MINGTNEGSYLHGWWQGSLTGPRYDPGSNWYPNSENYTCALNGGQVLEYPPKVNGVVDPAVTNTTACQDGFFNGWKYWCTNHAVNCVGNITSGYLPEMLVKTHQEYLKRI